MHRYKNDYPAKNKKSDNYSQAIDTYKELQVFPNKKLYLEIMMANDAYGIFTSRLILVTTAKKNGYARKDYIIQPVKNNYRAIEELYSLCYDTHRDDINNYYFGEPIHVNNLYKLKKIKPRLFMSLE